MSGSLIELGMAAAKASIERICGATCGMRKNMPIPAAASSTPQAI